MQSLNSLTAPAAPLQANADGIYRVGGTRVRLDSILTAFQHGSSAEEIAIKFPSVELTDIYTIITYYLCHRKQMDEYLKLRGEVDDTVRAENEARFPAEGIRDRLLTQRGTTS